MQDSANDFKIDNRKTFSSPTGEKNLGEGPQRDHIVLLHHRLN